MHGTEPHILVVDDDSRLRELLRKYLTDNGFVVSTAADAADARAKLAGLAFDLIVLDVMMPGESGLDLTAALKAEGDIPILLLTAMGEPDDRIAGLERGADDYLAKPFEPRELVLRITNVLRRPTAAAPADPPPEVGPIRLGRFAFDPEREELSEDGARIRLTSAETRLLGVLARNAGQVLTRDALSDLGGIAGNARTVDVQVTRLRRKIEDDPKLPRYLHTVRGEGYVLRPDP
jgi:two-component system phosphate regulon response regulator OmpR